MNERLLALFFITLLCFSVFAQDEDREMLNAKQDEDRVALFKQYMDELQEAQKNNDDSALIQSYSKLSRFYNLSGIFEKSKYYKKKELEVILNLPKPDSAMVYMALCDIQSIYFAAGEIIDVSEIHYIYKYAIRTNDLNLKEAVLSLYRSYTIDHFFIKDLKDFYTIYPEELKAFKKEGYVNYLKIMALFFEVENEIDSANYYFQLASENVNHLTNPYWISKFYTRYGEFNERQKKYDAAISNYLVSLDYSNKTGYLPYILEATTRLEELYALKNDFEAAYRYSTRNISLKDSLNRNANRDDLLRLEIEKEDELRALELQKLDLYNASVLNKAQNRTIISIVIGVLILLVAIGLWSRMTYTNRLNGLLKTAKDRAVKSEQFKQQFLANMSHEIRTPMNAILGMSNLMLETSIDEQQKKYLEATKTSCENLLVIVNDVLDLSKLEAGKMELEHIPFKVEEQIRIAKDTLRFKAEEKGITMKTHISEDVPKMLIGDPSRLNQILINLLGNAIKFTQKGGVELLVETGGELATLIFRIKDSGIGIPSDQVDQLFTSFRQVDASTSRKYGGTGLGLSISKTLIELQGGSIEVKSEEGIGSEFIVKIPYTLPDTQELEAEIIAVEVSKNAMNGIRILVAEDNEFNQIVVNDTLKKMIDVVHIDIADNGKIAVDMHRQNDYDVILMDVNMPEMDGHEASKAIRQMELGKKDIPIIALTASVLPSEVQKCQDAGMNYYVPKPFKREDLMDALRSAYLG